MNKINEFISYIPKQFNPLSAEVFFIDTKDKLYIYDVGNGQIYLEEIKRQTKPLVIVLSHFHPDHIYNLKQLDNYALVQSKNTAKYTKKENYLTQVNEDVQIYDIPSSHAKGCLALEYKDYLFVGDAFYPSGKGAYNVNALNQQIQLLEKSTVKYIICSHHEPLIQRKEEVLQELKEIYRQRNPKEAFIFIER